MNDRMLWYASIAAGVVVLVDSIYLSYSKLTHQAVFCGTYGGCETVNSSPYSEIAGIPIAILGVGAYLVLLGLLFLERRGGYWRVNGPILVFGLSLAGVLYSAYLTWIEIAVIHAICPYCVVSAVAITFLFIFTSLRLFRGQEQTNPI